MKKVLDFLEKAIKLICSVMFIGIMIMIALQVITRYLMNNALTWSEHAARGLFIWTIMLYAGVLVRQSGNLGFDLIAKSLPATLNNVFNLICEAGILAFAVYWCIQGAALCGDLAKFKFADLKLSYVTIYAAEPVGAAFVALFSAEAFVNRVKTMLTERRMKKC